MGQQHQLTTYVIQFCEYYKNNDIYSNATKADAISTHLPNKTEEMVQKIP